MGHSSADRTTQTRKVTMAVGWRCGVDSVRKRILIVTADSNMYILMLGSSKTAGQDWANVQRLDLAIG